LDEIMDLLHAGGIRVDLATATASPPPWLTSKHPEVLPETEDGSVLWPGGRQQWRPTSAVFRRYALELVRRLAERYREHPALVAWHVSNELGCHNAYDYSDDAAAAFRTWLLAKYGDVEEINRAWGTSFWSQRYSDVEQILPPRQAASFRNPTQQLDFARFSSDTLLEHYRAEAEILHRITPGIPVTTNFMVNSDTKALDYARWAKEMDFVSNDHYTHPTPRSLDELSFSANLTSGISGHRPWFLMEHSPGGVNWQEVNPPKARGDLARHALTHVAHGADAVCYFQWRQSASGAEKYHAGMVPHTGADSRIFRDVIALGARLRELSPVAGSHRSPAPVALLFDWDAWWTVELDAHPHSHVRYREELVAWYGALLDAGVRADVVPVDADLTGYQAVLAPLLHVVPADLATKLEAHVNGGGNLVTGWFSGIVDQDDHVYLGGYPGAFRDLLGIRVEEFGPLLAGRKVPVDLAGQELVGTLWADEVDLVAADVEVLASFRGGVDGGELAGMPALTRRPHGAGSASYVATRLGPEDLAVALRTLLAGVGVTSELPEHLRGAVEHVVRTDGEQFFHFLVNRTDHELDLPGAALPARGVEVRTTTRAAWPS
jgi:beta-galactosidase